MQIASRSCEARDCHCHLFANPLTTRGQEATIRRFTKVLQSVTRESSDAFLALRRNRPLIKLRALSFINHHHQLIPPNDAYSDMKGELDNLIQRLRLLYYHIDLLGATLMDYPGRILCRFTRPIPTEYFSAYSLGLSTWAEWDKTTPPTSLLSCFLRLD